LSCETLFDAANYALYVGEVLAVTLWIVVGVLSITVLGFVCSWVLNARGGLEAAHPTERRKPAVPDDDPRGLSSRRHGGG